MIPFCTIVYQSANIILPLNGSRGDVKATRKSHHISSNKEVIGIHTPLEAYAIMDKHTTQHPVEPFFDLRDMLRQYMIERSLLCMEQARLRGTSFGGEAGFEDYKRIVRKHVQNIYGVLPIGKNAGPVNAEISNTFDGDGYRIENVLFESHPGWQVCATVFIPTQWQPPFPAIVVPCGHSGREGINYNAPARYFAKNGYVSVLVEAPGMGEKWQGNNHFTDGILPYLVGETSSRYFIADALRAIDYLETRPDVDMNHGIAMTGVSGGGVTTIFSALLDDRISLASPSCAVAPLSTLDITQCYSGCPESHMWRRYANLLDEADLLCALAPTPVLMMTGALDEVFLIDDVKPLMHEVKTYYEEYGSGDRFESYIDDKGHCYSLTQAREFIEFTNRMLLNNPERHIIEPTEADEICDPPEHLRANPDKSANMHSLTKIRADELEEERVNSTEGIQEGIRKLLGVGESVFIPDSRSGNPFRAFSHIWQQVMLCPEAGIELPATLLLPVDGSSRAILHIDDAGRNRLLDRQGFLTAAAGYLEPPELSSTIMTVDLRGWGDTTPAVYPYDLVSWGGVDRYLAHTSAALGDPLMYMRVRDALGALAYLRNQQGIDPGKIVLTGCGLGGVVALIAAAADGNVEGVIVWDTLVSFKSLIDVDDFAWPAEAVIPNVLLHFDLPELAESLPMPVKIINPLGAKKESMEDQIAAMNENSGCELYYLTEEASTIGKVIQSFITGI